MNYEEKYKNALDRARHYYLTGKGEPVDFIKMIFPELAESDDERTRKEIIDFLGMPHPQFVGKRDHEKWIAWLEKLGESDKSLYIRFGDIPTNGKSKVYNGEIEIGIEEGISVYPAFEDKDGNIILGLNLPITKTSLHTQQHLLEYESRPCYLVTGDYVGKGTDGEPLIKNVKIIKEIKPYRIKQDKENNTYIINNTPNCGISVSYNEELKENEDERLRKEIVDFITSSNKYGTNERCEAWLNWLEKQDKNSQPDIPEDGQILNSLADVDERVPLDRPLTLRAAIAWLEKQGWLEKQCEQPTDKVEPKFKAGDYIVPDNITPLEIWRVINIDEDGYYNVQSITNHEDDEIYRVPAFALEKDYYNLDNVKKKN